MRIPGLLLLAALPLPAADSAPPATIQAFGYKWSVPFAEDWKIEKDNGGDVLVMLKARPPVAPEPRRPTQFALAEVPDYGRVRIEVDVKRHSDKEKSIILVYGWKDAAHFNYAHLSVDDPAKQPVHNGIFHVYGGDRVRISPTTGGPGGLADLAWHHVQLTYDAAAGEVRALVDGKQSTALRGIDLSTGAGRVGIGSFFETASFKNFKLTGVPVLPK